LDDLSKLQEEPFEKVVDDKDLVEAMAMVEEVYGTVQCNNCQYWGKMEGWIEPNDKKNIKFVCPKCNALELVTNPELKDI
jgi:Zn finger protein HypA/HybF involved in hydrogenase expression